MGKLEMGKPALILNISIIVRIPWINAIYFSHLVVICYHRYLINYKYLDKMSNKNEPRFENTRLID